MPKTGILDIDEPKKEENDPFGAFSLSNMSNMMNAFDEKKPERFVNYFLKKSVKGAREIFDLDSYYSMALGDEDPSDDAPIACLLPQLLSTIYLIHDENLERRTISIIMRIFNQRNELLRNVQSLQVIFDPQKTLLYELLKS